MSRTENVELTTLCLIYEGNHILLQNRVKKDWKGYTFPGGHVEPGESIVTSVIREMKEETGLTTQYTPRRKERSSGWIQQLERRHILKTSTTQVPAFLPRRQTPWPFLCFPALSPPIFLESSDYLFRIVGDYDRHVQGHHSPDFVRAVYCPRAKGPLLLVSSLPFSNVILRLQK